MDREEIERELKAELDRRDEWYGLDNWSLSEVVDFVADRIEGHPAKNVAAQELNGLRNVAESLKASSQVIFGGPDR